MQQDPYSSGNGVKELVEAVVNQKSSPLRRFARKFSEASKHKGRNLVAKRLETRGRAFPRTFVVISEDSGACGRPKSCFVPLPAFIQHAKRLVRHNCTLGVV